MLMLDQTKILLALDALITVTEFIKDQALLEYTQDGRDYKRSNLPDPDKKTAEQTVFDPNRQRRSLTNILRRIVLRV